jgi:hypothetical protein
MAVVMDGAIAAAAGIITGGAEVVATIMVGIIAITGNANSKRPLNRRPLSFPIAETMSPFGPSRQFLCSRPGH